MQVGFWVGTQTPAVQVCPGPHAAQLLPLKPQAVALVVAAGTHWVPLQQPAQVVELQVVPPVQTPVVQVAPVGQVPHDAPLTPHERGVCELAGWHAPFAQHPAQLKKSQAVAAEQTPREHDGVVPVQAEQVCPPVPHWVPFWFPKGTHRLPWQHPFAQLVGVQVVTVVHAPLEQVAVPHDAHEAPARPQELLF